MAARGFLCRLTSARAARASLLFIESKPQFARNGAPAYVGAHHLQGEECNVSQLNNIDSGKRMGTLHVTLISQHAMLLSSLKQQALDILQHNDCKSTRTPEHDPQRVVICFHKQVKTVASGTAGRSCRPGSPSHTPLASLSSSTSPSRPPSHTHTPQASLSSSTAGKPPFLQQRPLGCSAAAPRRGVPVGCAQHVSVATHTITLSRHPCCVFDATHTNAVSLNELAVCLPQTPLCRKPPLSSARKPRRGAARSSCPACW